MAVWGRLRPRVLRANAWIVHRAVNIYQDALRWFFEAKVFRFYRWTRLWTIERYAPIRRIATRKRGWLSEEIDRATKEARPSASIGKTLGFELPRSTPLLVMEVIVASTLVLAACSVGLNFLSWRLGLPIGASLNDLYTTMWQVQAGIAALALPVLLFVVERSRDDPRAAFRSPEILLRDSYAYQIMAFSFIVVGHIGLDLAWFGSSAAVVLFDLVLVALTLVLAMYAYFKVVQLLMSSSLLHDRSLALGNERMADAAWRSGRLLKGGELLRREFETAGVNRWLFQNEDAATQLTISIKTSEPKYLDDVDLPALRRFLNRLPRKSDVDASTTQTFPTASPTTTPEPAIWYLLDYGRLIRPPGVAFLRIRRDAFEDIDEAGITSALNACVHLRASDDF
ncbi:MAG: hypothetical protein ACJ757_13920 [Gaiellaceae bacterium]